MILQDAAVLRRWRRPLLIRPARRRPQISRARQEDRTHDFRNGIAGNETGLPMTYMMNGRQFIVVATGSRARFFRAKLRIKSPPRRPRSPPHEPTVMNCSPFT